MTETRRPPATADEISRAMQIVGESRCFSANGRLGILGGYIYKDMQLRRTDIRGAVLQAEIRPASIGECTYERPGIAAIHPQTTGWSKDATA